MKVSRRFCFQNRATLVVAACGLGLVAASQAHAAPCSGLTNPVYVAGSTAVKPFVALVAKELLGLSTPITVVYQGQGSCTGVQYLATTPSGTITGTGTIWDATGMEVSGGCELSTTGDTVDIGLSDVYAESCSGTTLPADVKDFFGPIQTMTFVVPGGATNASSATVISGEAAYMVFGFGNDSGASPWTDETVIEQRNSSSGTQQMLAAAIKVPAAKWKGTMNGKSSDVIASLVAAQSAGKQDQAIGILGADGADTNRSKLKELGYQHFGQDCAYWPDSAPDTFDKTNVRDGHYFIWGPLHMLSRTANGMPVNDKAKAIIDYLSGAVDPTGFDLIKVEAMGGVVPSCAMRVKRTSEVGPLMSFMPDKSCGCKYTADANGMAPSDCKTCDSGHPCDSGQSCNYGYCEVK
jgi:ABC-type phosphate transport system substrate-binding protein